MRRTGRLKGVTQDGEIVGFVLVGQTPSAEFPQGICDVTVRLPIVALAKSFVGQRVVCDGVYREGGQIGHLEAFAIELAKGD